MRPYFVFTARLFLLGIVGLTPAAVLATVRFEGREPVSLDIPSAPLAQAIAVADLDGDRRDDIIVADPDGQQISVFFNDGDGTFSLSDDFATNGQAVAVAVGDFNRDAKQDIVAVNRDTGTVNIFLGDGEGDFNVDLDEDPFYTVGPSPRGVVVADFDADRRLDLAVLSDTTIYLLKGQDGGTFVPFLTATLSLGAGNRGAYAIASGKFDNNGSVDLVVSNQGSLNASVLLGHGDGDGTFAAAQTIGLPGGSPSGLVVGNFNRDDDPDGFLDVAVVLNQFDLNLAFLYGRGDGTFQNPRITTGNIEPLAITTIDADGDGKLDLVLGAIGDNTLLMCQQTSTVCNDGFNAIELSFQPQSFVQLGSDTAVPASGNLDGNDLPDLVFLRTDADSGEVTLVPAINITGSTELTKTPTPIVSATPMGPSATPTPSAPTVTQTPTRTAIPTATASPVPTAPYGVCHSRDVADLPSLQLPVAVTTGDYDRDGSPDIAVADKAGNKINLFLTQPSTAAGNTSACDVLGLSQGAVIPDIAAPLALATSDLDRDGRLDLAVVGADGLSVFFGNGAGSFTAAAGNPRQAGVSPGSLAIADVNRDGLPDVLVANGSTTSDSVSVFLGEPGRTFAVSCAIPVGRAATLVVADDLNIDGLQDFAVASDQVNDVLVFQRVGPTETPTPGVCPAGTNGFRGLTQITLSGQPTGMAVGPIDTSDTVPDLAITLDQSSVQVLTGRLASNGDVLYSVAAPIILSTTSTPPRPSAIGIADIIRDGKPDLAVTDQANDQVIILRGFGDGTFSQSSDPFAIGGGPRRAVPVALAIADFDGDGVPDVVTANSGDGTISVLISSRPRATPTPSQTATPTVTATPTMTGTATITGTPTVTLTPTATVTPTRSPRPTFTDLPAPTMSPRGIITLSNGACAMDPQAGAGATSWVWCGSLLALGAVCRRSVKARRRA